MTTSKPLIQELVLSGKKLPLNTLLTFNIDRDALVIPDPTRDKVLAKLRNAWTKVAGNTLDKFPNVALLCDIDWHWVTDRGKLPKRIRSFMHKEFKFEVSEYIQSEIGNVCLNELPTSQNYYFDISTKLNWRKGDFGDHQSCFLNVSGAPTCQVSTMQRNGKFNALRFFRPFDSDIAQNHSSGYDGVSYTQDGQLYLGVSRAWLFRHSEDATVLFNSYGFNMSTSADILSRYLGTSKYTVGIDETDIDINGSQGYWISKEKSKRDWVDFDAWSDHHRYNDNYLVLDDPEEDPDF